MKSIAVKCTDAHSFLSSHIWTTLGSRVCLRLIPCRTDTKIHKHLCLFHVCVHFPYGLFLWMITVCVRGSFNRSWLRHTLSPWVWLLDSSHISLSISFMQMMIVRIRNAEWSGGKNGKTSNLGKTLSIASGYTHKGDLKLRHIMMTERRPFSKSGLMKSLMAVHGGCGPEFTNLPVK